MGESNDEVSTSYGMLAEALQFPADISSVTYRLRPQARWHDGKRVSPDDVIFSFNALKANNPLYVAYYQHVVKAEQSGEREVTFMFDGPGNRELPSIVGQLPVLPKHWWEGTDASGKKRDILQTSLEPPLGCGAYKVKSFEVGRRVVYERVADHWGKDINVNLGRNNFDEVRYEYFRDLTVALEAFKGDQYDFRFENSAKDWATGYDFPAVREKRAVLEEFPIRNRGLMQAYAFNTRRDKFKDPRVRRAFNYAYDFEEMNKQLMFGQYARISSYWEGCELASSGLPQGLELEILGTVRDKVPAEVFTTVYTNPVNGTPEAVRNNLREALRLLREAGYEVRNQRLVNVRTGEPFVCELLVQDPSYERFILFFKPSLERLGINISLRIVDEVQYQNRIRSFDFDIVIQQWPESLSPGNEQRDQWGSQSADRVGSDNLVGIKNPAVDALIDRVIFAKNRAELVAATKALDRVLLWNHYVVPQYNYSKDRTARWDRFGRPDLLPTYTRLGAFPTVWWWDADKAAKVGARR
jgi:microcin C transport system substrate-binding protein